MFSRITWNLLTLASLATIAGVAWYFWGEYRAIADRQDTVYTLRKMAQTEGPCAALTHATRLGTDLDYDLLRNVEVLRGAFAEQILGEADARGQRALLEAGRDDLLSGTLCEQIHLMSALGEVHPVLALLRFTREKDPCADALALEQVIDGLGSHRSLLLRGLMEDVSRLECLTPELAQKVAYHVAGMTHDDPQAFDDQNVLRIAAYLSKWAPMRAAQVGCRIDAFGDISRLGSTIGCSESQMKNVLTRFRYPHPIASGRGGGELPAGSEVFLIWEDKKRCEVRPVDGVARVVTVACRDLELVSGLELAVAVEKIKYGVVQADLVAGLASYDGRRKSIGGSTVEPEGLKSWYAYSREGRPLGTSRVVSIRDLAAATGEYLPEFPLRKFCQDAGARFCYDVDWTQLLSRIEGEPVVFLSRPLDVFMSPQRTPDSVLEEWWQEAFGRLPSTGSMPRVYPLLGDGLLLVEATVDTVDFRWRLGEGKSWQGQVFGSGEPGSVPPAARLVAAMDLEGDGRPELLLQRFERVMDGGRIRTSTEEMIFVSLSADNSRFTPITQLTIHEY